MLQEISAPYKWDGGDWQATYMAEGSGHFVALDDNGQMYREFALPPGVVLAQEVAPDVGDTDTWTDAELQAYSDACARDTAQSVDAPAPADPFMPSAEVRAALRVAYYGNGEPQPAWEVYDAAVQLVEQWVWSWPPPPPRLSNQELTRRAGAEAERRRRYGPWGRGKEAQP